MEMPLNDKENWAEIVELARKGDFVTLVEFYPREAVLYFANLQAIASTVPLAKKPALKRCATSEFFGDTETAHKRPKTTPGLPAMIGGALEWFAEDEYTCEVCKRRYETQPFYEFSYTTSDNKQVHVDKACNQCYDTLRSGVVQLFDK